MWALANPVRTLTGVLVVIALSTAGVQTLRLSRAQAQADARAEELRTLRLSLDYAQAQAKARADETGARIVTQMESQHAQDRPVVERVTTRIVRQCAGPDHLQVPAHAGAPEPARREAQDGRAFARDLADDLDTCQRELTRLDAVIEWVRANQ